MKTLLTFLTCLIIAGCTDTITAPRSGLAPSGDPDQYTTKGDPDRWWQPQSDTNKWWSASSRAKHQKNASLTVAVYQSVDGAVVVPDSLFTEPYLFVRNCTGSRIYDESSYFRASQGSLIENIPSDPSCSGAGIGSFQPVNGSIVIVKPLNFRDKAGAYDTSAVFTVTVVDEPDYALSYVALPRILLVISQ